MQPWLAIQGQTMSVKGGTVVFFLIGCSVTPRNLETDWFFVSWNIQGQLTDFSGCPASSQSGQKSETRWCTKNSKGTWRICIMIRRKQFCGVNRNLRDGQPDSLPYVCLAISVHDVDKIKKRGWDVEGWDVCTALASAHINHKLMSQHLVFLPSLYSLFSGIQEPAKKISHFHTVILLVKVSHQNFDANNFPVTQTFGTSINIYTDKISLGAFYKRALQITDYFNFSIDS